MCFLNDGYTWTADVQVEKDTVATQSVKCDECQRTVYSGGFLHTIHQAEGSGECVACRDRDCDCNHTTNDDCQCAEPNYGETFDYQRCQDCHHFLAAVEAAELAAGCSLREARPPFGMLRDEMQNAGASESAKYFRSALRLYPHLKSNQYLGWLWKNLFHSRRSRRVQSR